MLKNLIKLQKGDLGGVVTKLANRKVIHVEGTDTYTFLNGLVTNKLERTDEVECIYGAFLNRKGRLISDSLFYHRPSLNSYMIEVSNETEEKLVEHMQSFKMRKKVYFDVKEFSESNEIYSILCSNIEWRDRILRNLLNRGDLGNTMGLYMDPRWELSIRVVVPKGTTLPLEGRELVYAEHGQQKEYDYFRMLHGIPEGQQEMPYEKQIALEANIQNLHGVNFDKGCYIGQELVARTHYTGMIRKRLLPLRRIPPYIQNPKTILCSPYTLVPSGFIEGIADIDDSADLIVGNSIKWGEGTEQELSGNVVNGQYNIAFGVVRLEQIMQKNSFSIDGTILDPKETDKNCWQVIVPSWLAQQQQQQQQQQQF